MSVHLQRDLDSLHRELLSMCASVEEMIHQAVETFSAPCPEMSQELADRDNEIDQQDVDIEENCLKILALHQPVAVDLRRITTVLKISSELERVADLGVHIAERASELDVDPDVIVPQKLKQMAQIAVNMVHHSIDAYVELDSDKARAVCAEDDQVDNLNREIINDLTEIMKSSPETVDSALRLFTASRHIERVADHATNIAEDVFYLVEGQIIRHHDQIYYQ